MKKKILIVVSNYYENLSNNLISNCLKTLKKEKIIVKIVKVSGTFEIPLIISKNSKKYDAFIALGCVIKGETPHFDYICSSTFNGLMSLSINSKKPIGNGIITSLNLSQAKKRSMIKGKEAADAVIGILKND
mgnify:FL=1